MMQESDEVIFTDFVKDLALTEHDFSKKVSDSHLVEFSIKCCSSGWRLLYPFLKLDKTVADDIDRGPGSQEEKREAYLKEWKQRRGSEATYKVLVGALLKINRKEDAGYLCQLLLKSSKEATNGDTRMKGSEGTDDNAPSASSPQPISNEHYREVRLHYSSYVNSIRTSLQSRQVAVYDLRMSLLFILAFDNQKPEREKIKAAASIDEIFMVLSSELLTSYLNYEIFDHIVKQFHLDESEESLRYPEYLDAYKKLHNMDERMESLTITDASKRLAIKMDPDLSVSLAKIVQLKDAVSNVFGLKASELRLHSIEEGVIVTFLVSSSVADCILGRNQTQVQMLCGLGITWLDCCGTILYFRKSREFSDQYAEMSDGHDHIGNGMFGSVFRSTYKHHRCAAKLLTYYALEKATEGGQLTLKHVCEKCNSLKALQDENIVRHLATAIESTSNLPILISELMDGNLKQFLEDQNEKFSLSRQLSLCHDIAKGLEFLHSQDIIHLNIRDSNILIAFTESNFPQAKVGDYAMSRILPHDTIVACPPAYRQVYYPPEKLQNYSYSFDVYSFGVIAVQIIKLKTGITKRTELLLQFEEIPKYHVLKQMIESCLFDDPKKRPRTSDLVEIIYSNNVF